jgi:hypothetical protein
MMKTLSILIIAFPLLMAGCKTNCVEDAGVRVERVEVFKDFDELEINGPIKVVLLQDSATKVRISADTSVISLVKADVSSGKLKLKLDPEKYCGQDSVIAYTSFKMLKSVRLESGSEVASTSLLNFRDIEFTLNGSTTVNLEMSASIMTTTIDGTADMNLKGQSGEHNIKSNGVLNLTAPDFVVAKYKINTEGVGKSTINVLNDLNIETSGTSEIFYKGSPKNISKKKTGVATLEKVN